MKSEEDRSKIKILLTKINEELRQDWKKEEFIEGKNISIQWVWIDTIQEAINHYLFKGWTVKKIVQLGGPSKKLILNFKNPKWKLED